MIRMRIIPVPLTSRASIFSGLNVWIPAFTTNAGVFDVVAPPTSFACHTSYLLTRKYRKMSMSWLPVFPLHEAYDAPGKSSGECPRPDASTMSFLTGQFCMQSRALLGKPSTPQTLEVMNQVVVRCMDCGRFLHWLTVGAALSKLTLVKGGEHDTRIFEHLWPWPDLVHAATTWLLMFLTSQYSIANSSGTNG